MSEYMNGTYATIKVEDGDSLSWPVVERLGDGWQSGAHYYPDSKVRAVRVLNVVPEPRTITTAEELDALPNGSVIVDRDLDAWQRYTTGWTCADRAMNTVDQPSVNLTNILGPATVLWEPK